MSSGLVKGLCIGGIVFFLVLVGVGSYISAKNYGVRTENGITARWENMQNVLGSYSLKIKEATKVTNLQMDNLKEVMEAAFSGRYGDDGSQAVFQFIKEAYPGQIDNALYIKLMQLIEAGRNEFKNEQTQLIDLKKTYKDQLGYVWSGFWLDMAGYPNLKIGFPHGTQDDYKIIQSQHSKKTFESGIDEGIEISSGK